MLVSLIALLVTEPATEPQPQPIVRPPWVRVPGQRLIFPKVASQLNISGRTVLTCTVTATGHLSDCTVAKESPQGLGFGEAALKASVYFQMRTTLEDGTPTLGAKVAVPLAFSSMDEDAEGDAPPKRYAQALGCIAWTRVRLDFLPESQATIANLERVKTLTRRLGKKERIRPDAIEQAIAAADVGGASGLAKLADPALTSDMCMLKNA